MLMHNTPDYRGVFLRGIGGNAAGLGELQGDAIRNITGNFGYTIHVQSLRRSSGCFSLGTNYYAGDGGSSYSNDLETGLINFDASHVVPTANENRPVNRAVRYFIKAK